MLLAVKIGRQAGKLECSCLKCLKECPSKSGNAAVALFNEEEAQGHSGEVRRLNLIELDPGRRDETEFEAG